jgi:hypothetical protein
VLDPDADIVLVGDSTTSVEAKLRLARVGYDRVVGQLDDLGSVLRDETRDVEASARLTIQQLAELRGLDAGLQLVDVRAPSETGEGTLRGSREIPLPLLTDFIADLDPMNPWSSNARAATAHRSLRVWFGPRGSRMCPTSKAGSTHGTPRVFPSLPEPETASPVARPT